MISLLKTAFIAAAAGLGIALLYRGLSDDTEWSICLCPNVSLDADFADADAVPVMDAAGQPLHELEGRVSSTGTEAIGVNAGPVHGTGPAWSSKQ